MKRKSPKCGVVLLLVLMVLAILIVVVGQFSTTAVLDWKIAKNREMEAQLTLDVRAGVEAAVEALTVREEDEEGSFTLTLDREASAVGVRVEDETGKFNVNTLLAPPEGISQEKAEAALRRLLDQADDPPGTLPTGCADGIVAFLRDRGAPLPTLGALLAVEGIDAATLWGADDGDEAEEGLSSLLTVHGDGKIRPMAGDDRVMLCLSPRFTPAILQQAIAFIRNPTPTPPPKVAALAQDVLPWTTWESVAFAARVKVRREGSAKKVRVVLGPEKNGFPVIRNDELE